MEIAMERTTDKTAQACKDEQVVLMYPGNRLKSQVREFDDFFECLQSRQGRLFRAEITAIPAYE